MRALPSSLHTEVQSPGFSSRLSSYVRGDEEECEVSPYVNSPRYSKLGVPVVTLKKKILPKLTAQNSEKVGRKAGRLPVTLRIGPQEPYSPFKRFSCSVERAERSLREEGNELYNKGKYQPAIQKYEEAVRSGRCSVEEKVKCWR